MIGYRVKIEGLRELETDLGMARDKTRNILKAAINNTAKDIENRMSGGAKKRYTLHGGKSAYHKANKIKKASVNKLEAIIIASSRPEDTLNFTVRPNTYFPGSVGAPAYRKARTVRGSKLAAMFLKKSVSKDDDQYRAFVVKYPKTGHYALAERVPGSRMKKKPWKEALKSLYGTTKAKGEEIVYKQEIDKDVYSILSEQISLQIPRFVK